jgi:N-acetylglucosamine malate deacetylase 2
MKILYLFPHPDDESFGPAGAIDQQVKGGNQVYLVTLTRGGATKVRHKLNLSIEQMGLVRIREMEKVQEVLGIKEMHILDYEDGGLALINPLHLETIVEEWITKIQPNIMVTYPVHGGSGHHDHIALHAAVNRVFHALKPNSSYLKRLAFFTLPDTEKPMFMEDGTPRVTWTPRQQIGAIVKLTDQNVQRMKEALLCYETYQEMVKTTRVVERIGDKVHFELAGETHPEPLQSLTEGI